MSDAPDKSSVRKATCAARRVIPAHARTRASTQVAERLLALPGVATARTVLAYAATPEELDVGPTLDALRERGARVAFPRVCAPGELSLHWVTGPESLAPGYCGIAEPVPDAETADPSEIDLALVPGAAFDAACHRLGMGGGFYDRLLPRLRADALKVGVAFDEQIVDAVPTEGHDVALDAIVTPTRTLLAGGEADARVDGSAPRA